MMLYKNTQVKIDSLGVDMDFNIGVLQGDSLAPYLFIICSDYILLTSIDLINENGKEQLELLEPYRQIVNVISKALIGGGVFPSIQK